MTKREQVEKFTEALADYGEYFFPSGSITRDLKNIQGVIALQGFWSGIRYRLYFDKEFNCTKVEERRFG